MDEDLLNAYTHTTYELDTGNSQACFRIGKQSQDLIALLEQHHQDQWAYVTAWNPGSRQQEAACNNAAHRRLIAVVEELGLPYYPGRGRGDVADWPAEPGILVLGLSRSAAVRLGREFGQVAILAGDRQQPPEIVLCPPFDQQR